MSDRDASAESLRLTRSATIFNALLRVYGTGKLPSPMVLHIIGADHRLNMVLTHPGIFSILSFSATASISTLNSHRTNPDFIRSCNCVPMGFTIESPPALSQQFSREGRTPDQTRSVFKDLHDWLWKEGVRTLSMLLCGPNIAPGFHGNRYTFCHQPLTQQVARRDDSGRPEDDDRDAATTAGHNSSRGTGRRTDRFECDDSASLTVRLQFDHGLYHDIADSLSAPDAMFLFNAGLWGYDDWLPTIERILSPVEASTEQKGLSLAKASKSSSIIVTSYCAEEAEDDMDTLETLLVYKQATGDPLSSPNIENLEVAARLSRDLLDSSSSSLGRSVGGVEWLWGPEVNPHRSLVPRSTACGEEGRLLFENHSWQAIRPLQLGNCAKDASITR